MPTSTPPSSPSSSPLPTDQQLAQRRQEQYETLKRNLALACLVGCPAIMALPPRKLDLYTFALGAVWVVSANQAARSYTGRGVWQHVAPLADNSALPTERAREVQRALREREERERGEREALGRRDGVRERGLLEKVWMGDEKEGWKERRLQEEREALEEGRGYGSMIMEQIWEVWNWGKKGEGEGDGSKKEGDS
ncbi:hypothetical protein AOQ84DRAFT_330578 [Glonium stellatum]|uniref:Uncharacterized protein n=1 Tax=Glonium stellatum TaxID=574774 RepID=A0A8E2JZ16_9PEZI|nr:hypothetical protein AOQ84DRAFT_330578 [Glonium stellatum]